MKGGVSVKFDAPDHVTHTKLVLIDGKTALVGSHNWSLAALSYNYESSVLVRSEKVAEELTRYFMSLWTKAYSAKAVMARRKDQDKKQ